MSRHRDPTTRASLLSRLREGKDEAAWREFHARYGEMILAWCLRMGLRPWDAEDVRQRVMIDLTRALGSGFRYRPELGRFRHYLGRVVRNRIYRFSAEQRGMEPGAGVEVGVGDDELDARWEEEWRDHHLRLALRAMRGSLAPNHRELLDRLMRGESAREAAVALTMTEAAVRKAKERLLAELRERVRLQVLDEDGFES